MKERPIIFSSTMIRAILEGKKTMTRRVIKLKPPVSEFGREWSTPFTNDGITWVFTAGFGMAMRQLKVRCPYGGVGDRLWVRETWHLGLSCHGDCPGYKADMKYKCGESMPTPFILKWKPSISMPRWASRILLEITGVRAERLQEITPLDAVLEGCPKYHEYKNGECIKTISPIDRFRLLWDSINAKRGYGWGKNPWVWIIDFEERKGDWR